MHKKLVISLVLFFLLVLPALSLASVPDAIQFTNMSDFWRIIIRVLNLIWPIFVGLAIIMFLVSGFLFLTAQGEPNTLKIAKDSLIWGIIGVIVGILSVSIPFIIGTVIGL